MKTVLISSLLVVALLSEIGRLSLVQELTAGLLVGSAALAGSALIVWWDGRHNRPTL